MRDLVIIGGGQSGLAAARAAREHGLSPLLLEAGPEAVGSWPHYYDSLTVFSPGTYSALAGVPFPGDPDHYPGRDEVVDYLREFAAGLDVEIRTSCHVDRVTPQAGGGFQIATADGRVEEAITLIAASGSFGNPVRPDFPGLADFGGEVLHVADYRRSDQYSGQRVVVVGGGNSAVQVAYELSQVAEVTIASHEPIVFFPQHPGGHDVHYWFATTGFDALPPSWLDRLLPSHFVMDLNGYQEALRSGRLERRPMFTGLDAHGVIWADGEHEAVDVVLLATGYRPDLAYLDSLGALVDGIPQHVNGLSTTHVGLAYVGIEFQRSFASNTLRGVYADAAYLMPPLAALVDGAAMKVGIA